MGEAKLIEYNFFTVDLKTAFFCHLKMATFNARLNSLSIDIKNLVSSVQSRLLMFLNTLKDALIIPRY